MCLDRGLDVPYAFAKHDSIAQRGWCYQIRLDERPDDVSTTNMLLKYQMISMNDTMIAFFAPEKHCAFPVYGISVWIVIFTLVKFGGYFVIVTVTTIVLHLSVEVENVKNMELLQMNNV